MNGTGIDTESLPLLFWACGLLIALLSGYALHQRRSSWALPCLAVLGTTTVWYLGDIVYTGIGPISSLFPERVIHRALWQVILFLVSYGLLCKEVSRWFVRGREDDRLIFEQSDIFETEKAQRQITMALWFAAIGWVVIFLISQYRNGWPLKASLFPYLTGRHVPLWGRDRLGGATGFLIATGAFIHQFFSAMLGVVFILSRRPRTRIVAGIMVALAWPFWLVGYARSVILALVVPAACGFFLFSRHRLAYRVATVLVLFLALNLWLKLVIATRTSGGVAETFVEIVEGRQSSDFIKTRKHRGLDMFKELCYMNHYIEKGTYDVNWGRGYFAELVNFIPRAWWHGKPTVGIEFSIARGSRTRGKGKDLVTSLITPGMVGQGVENFGYVLGPVAAAFLMSLWTGILAMFWTQRHSVVRACLFLVGLGLTFNSGRVITLQVFFPIVFGYLMIRIYEQIEQRHAAVTVGPTEPATSPQPAAPAPPH